MYISLEGSAGSQFGSLPSKLQISCIKYGTTILYDKIKNQYSDWDQIMAKFLMPTTTYGYTVVANIVAHLSTAERCDDFSVRSIISHSL